MLALEDFIIITSQDLPLPVAPSTGREVQKEKETQWLEGDCACPTEDTSLVISNQANPGLSPPEGDCAPIKSPTFKRLSFRQREDICYTSSEIYTDKLTEDFSLAFNLLGYSNVVALNQVAFSLLRAFQQPRTLVDGAQLVDRSTQAYQAAQNLVRSGLLFSVDNRYPFKQQVLPQTLTAWLHVTNACNLSCDYCYLEKTSEKMKIEQGQQAIEAIFRSALANGFHRIKLKYAGGEPTLNFPLVLALHDYARELSERYGLRLDGVVLSNGVAISERMINEMQCRSIRLSISMDGVGKYQDIHRRFSNGRGTFAHLECTLDRLAIHKLKPSINITVSGRNLQGLPEVVDYVLKRELPFTINFYRENQYSISHTDLVYQDEEIINAMRPAFAVIENNLPPYSLLGVLLDRARLDMPHEYPCGVGRSYLAIDHCGRVAKCHMQIKQSVTNIFVDDPLQVIREEKNGLQNYSVDNRTECRKCTWRYWCAGGCPQLTSCVTGCYDAKSPNCRIYKALFPEVLRLEGLRLLKYSGVLNS